jgi:hypothetical protein
MCDGTDTAVAASGCSETSHKVLLDHFGELVLILEATKRVV